MSTVILIGFSCAGKSTLRKGLTRWMRVQSIERKIEFVDTDDQIAGEEDAIYRLFITRVRKNGDRTEAIQFIEDQENTFLRTFTSASPDCIIAAGPLLPLRTEWPEFLKRTQAKCVWLTITPERAYKELRARQESLGNKMIDGKKLSQHWQYGCWNDGVVTYFHDSNRRWQLYFEDECINYIRKLIDSWSEVYKNHSILTLDFRSVRSDSEDAANMFKAVFELL